jgi:PAS domain S-box-containing protein
MKNKKPSYEDLQKQMDELKCELDFYKNPKSFKYGKDINVTEKGLRDYLKDWRGLFEGMEIGAALCEVVADENNKPVNYKFVEINKRYTELTGLTRDMVIGKLATEINPEIERYWIENLGKVAITGNPISYENYYEANSTYYSVYSYSPFKNYFASIVNDISTRKRAEIDLIEAKEKAEENEKNFKDLFDSINEAFALCEIIVDEKKEPVDYRFLNINPAFEDQTGLNIKNTIGKTVKQIYPDVEPIWIKTYGNVALTQKPIHLVEYNKNTLASERF